jgi:putative colanic acid biosynthesis acetyltransferase WcaF
VGQDAFPTGTVAAVDPSDPAALDEPRTNPGGYINPYSWKNRLGRVAWAIVYLFLYRPSPRFFGTWRRFLLRMFGARVGIAWLHQSTRVWAPWQLEIGDEVYIDEQVRLYNAYGLKIGSRTMISQNVFLCTASHDYAHPQYPASGGAISIGDDIWICADAFVAPGVHVGRGAVVGARAVVTRDVEPWTVVAGNPARFVKQRVLREVGVRSQEAGGRGQGTGDACGKLG